MIYKLKNGGIVKGQLGISNLPINPNLVRDVIKNAFLRIVPKSVAVGTANVVDSDRTVYEHKLPALKDIKNTPRYGKEILSDIGNPLNPVAIDPGNAFLLDRIRQKEYMEKLGYHLINETNYGPVSDAVKTLKATTGNIHIPIYQLGKDEVAMSEVEPIIGENGQEYYMSGTPFWGWYKHDGNQLWNANDYPVALYRHKITGDVYQRGFDLNDYGAHKHPIIRKEIEIGKYVLNPLNWFKDDFDKGYFDIYDKYEEKTKGNGIDFGWLRPFANLYDTAGNPFVQRTRLHKAPEGYQRMYKKTENKKQGGTINRFKNKLKH